MFQPHEKIQQPGPFFKRWNNSTVWVAGVGFQVSLPSLKLTFSPLEMDGWNTILSYWGPGLFWGAFAVSFREGNFLASRAAGNWVNPKILHSNARNGQERKKTTRFWGEKKAAGFGLQPSEIRVCWCFFGGGLGSMIKRWSGGCLKYCNDSAMVSSWKSTNSKKPRKLPLKKMEEMFDFIKRPRSRVSIHNVARCASILPFLFQMSRIKQEIDLMLSCLG